MSVSYDGMLPYVYDDGGRSKYFRAKGVGDCVCRAIAIASGKDYKEVYDALSSAMGKSPRNGVDVRSLKFKRLMKELGFEWVSLSGIGSHMSAHMIEGELPSEGRFVLQVAKHNVALVDGVVRDIWDSRFNSFNEPRRVYGYWQYVK